MVDIAPTTVEAPGDSFLHTWASLTTANHTGLAVSVPGAPDRTVQAVAATAGSATCTLEGSNDGTTWSDLHGPDGEILDFTGSGIAMVAENPLYIRARLTAVGSGAEWSVYLLSKSRMR